MNSANDKHPLASQATDPPPTPISTTATHPSQAKPRMVILGGSGFIGTRLINLLKGTNNYDLSNIDIAQSEAHPEITEKGDVRNLFDMLHALQGADTAILLAAQHRDNVHPLSLYAETNVDGMRNVLEAMSQNKVRRIIFFSSVSVYGLHRAEPNEDAQLTPVNEYGRTKQKAELLLQQWSKRHPERSVIIVRPTVVFGEGNRGNVYNLLHQIQSGRFLMVGNGRNLKSMAYVGNVAAFVQFLLEHNDKPGLQIYNYVDKPDYDMNRLVSLVSRTLHRHIPSMHFPLWIGLLGGYAADALSLLTRRPLAVSAQRVRKFCATTAFSSDKAMSIGFVPPFAIEEALERTLRYEFGE